MKEDLDVTVLVCIICALGYTEIEIASASNKNDKPMESSPLPKMPIVPA